jgi:transglutaminase-like putative cysteine protease
MKKINPPTAYSFSERVLLAAHFFAAELLLVFSALVMWYDVFPETTISGRMTALLAAVLFLFAVIGRLPGRWTMPASVLVSGGVAARLVYRKLPELVLGWLCLGNAYLEKYNSYYETEVRLGEGQTEMASMGLFVLLLLAVYVLWACSRGGKSPHVFLLLPAGVIVSELLVGESPKLPGIVLLLFGVAALQLGSWQKGDVSGTKKQILIARGAAFLLCAAVILGVAAGAGTLAEHLAAEGWKAKEFQQELENSISHFSLGNWNSKEKTVDNHMPQYTGDTVLVVELEKSVSGNIYLRNFYGTDYENGTWVCRTKEYEEACRKAGFDADEAARMLYTNPGYCMEDWFGEDEWISGQISYENPAGTAAPIPYASVISDENKFSFRGDSVVKKKLFTDSVSLQLMYTNGWNLEAMMRDGNDALASDSFFEWYNSYVSAYTKTSDEVPSVKSSGGYYYEDESLTAYERNLLRLQEADWIRQWLASRCSYSLDLPDNGETDSVEYFLSESHVGYCQHFASAGVLLLRQMGIPARYASGYIVKGDSFFKNTGGGYTAVVTDRAAHAWAEIYLDDIGWVPVEMTPGFSYGVTSDFLASQQPNLEGKEDTGATDTETADTEDANTENPDTDNVDTESTDADTENTDTEIPDTESTDTEGSDSENKPHINAGSSGGAGSSADSSRTFPWKIILRVAAMLCAAAGLTAFTVWLIRKKRYEYRQVLLRDMRRKRNAKAVRRINQRIYRKLRRKCRYMGNKLRDADYEELLIKTYPDISAGDWKTYMTIAKKAAFSNETMEDAEAEFCYRIYCSLRDRQQEF